MGDRWLDEVLEAAARGPLEVIARRPATVRAVQARLAAKAGDRTRGWVGLHLGTLWGNALSAGPVALLPEDQDPAPALPAGHPWAEKLADRPRLRARLRSHLERVHALDAAGADLAGLSTELGLLRRAGWGRGPNADAIARFLSRSPEKLERIAIGFGPDGFTFAGAFGGLEHRLLEHLGARRPVAAGAPSLEARLARRLPVYLVSDPAAEARAIAAAALGHDDTLVLVPDETTAGRVEAALSRNGIAAAADDTIRLATHALVSVLRPLVPLFETGGADPLHHEDLLRLLTHPVLARTVRDGDEKVVLSPRLAREFVVACRRIRLPVEDWCKLLRSRVATLPAVQADADESARSAAARRADAGQAILMRLEALSTAAKAGTFAAMSGLVSAIGLSDPHDRLGRTLVAALGKAGGRRVREEAFEDLVGHAVGTGRVGRGVTILPYGDYDGRDSGRLLLAGVHAKGLAREPNPDPFLGPGDLRVLGLPAPRRAAEERIALARWAISRAGEARGYFSAFDETGRTLTLPVELAAELELRRDLERASYGLAVTELPEIRDLGAYDAGGDPDPVTTQIDADWQRAGHRVLDAGGHAAEAGTAGEELDPTATSLDAFVARDETLVPDFLRPYLGRVDRGLPERFRLSASRLAHFTQCLYRAYLADVLRLEPHEETEEDLDPRELGTALHEILERATEGLRWVVPEAEVLEARKGLVERLQTRTLAAIEGRAAASGLDTGQAATEGRRGMAKRWEAHWRRYAEARIRSVEDVAAEICGPKALQTTAEWAAVWTLLQGEDDIKGVATELRRALFAAVATHVIAGEPLIADVSGFMDPVIKPTARAKNAAIRRRMEGVLVDPTFRTAALGPLVERFRALHEARPADAGDERVVGQELVFGEDRDGEGGLPRRMRFGGVDVPVSGRIDSVVELEGHAPSARGLRVVDYKSGTRLPKPVDVIGSFVEPQLVFYALALEERRALGAGELPAVPVKSVAHDGVRTAVAAKPIPVDATTLGRARGVFGAVLDRAAGGDFPLIPHPLGCPRLQSGYCDFADVCRFRASCSLPPALEAGSDEEKPE